jgi:hypothetical protein
VPYPIVLVLGGAVLGFVPGLPEVKLDPQVVLVIFLPPLLYGASIYANDLRGLTLNAVALVPARPDHLPHVRGHLLHSGHPRAVAARAHPAAWA